MAQRLGLLVLLGISLLGNSFSQQQGTSWDSVPFTTDAAILMKDASAVKTDKVYDATCLVETREIRIEKDGRTTQQFHLTYRIDSTQGISNWGTIGAHWQPWRQKQPTVRARVITPDGVEHNLDLKTLSDAPARQNTPDTYGDNRIYRGPLPAISVGSFVEEEITIEDTQPYTADGNVGRIWFGRPVPVQLTRIVVIAPKAANLRYEHRLLPELKITKVDEGEFVRVTFEQGPMHALPKRQPNLPGDVAAGPQLEYSTVASWKSSAAAYGKLSEPKILLDEVRPIVSEVIKPSDSRADKIAKLVARLHRDVRYTGIEFGESALVPRTPAEVLNRKYGDCKDKAALLTAMLRAAGVPAHLALLSAGYGQDVTPSLPGMGLFNHAIVYVPGTPELWIDATDQFGSATNIPLMDQGRLALVIRESTTALQGIPVSSPKDNLLVETREFRLAEYGPSNVVESSETYGQVDRSYRSSYGTKRDPKELQKEMEKYAKGTYLSDEEVKVGVNDAYDLTTPFSLRLEVSKAKRGNTSIRDSAVGIFLSGLTSRLPDYFKTEPETIDPKKKNETPEPPRTADFILYPGYITEWRYKIIPPPGFKLRANRQNRVQQLGPATLSQQYLMKPDGVLEATFRFDTVKSRYTVSEAEALRKAVLDLRKSNAIIIAWDQEGYSLLSSGKVREAVASFDSLVKLHPTESIHRVQVAYALLEAGLGEAARAEARQATTLEPTSALAHDTLGWVLQHDLIGRHLAKGFDLAGALAEYKKALELDPDLDSTRIAYAILLEYDSEGNRYTAKADLKQSIAQYEELKKRKSSWESLDDNLLFALFYAGKYTEVQDNVAKLDSKPTRIGLAIAAAAASEGSEAALNKSLELTSDEKARMEALSAAANKLLWARIYKPTADLLAKVNTGDSSLELIDAIRSTKRYEEIETSEKDPAAVVQKFLTFATGPNKPDEKLLELLVPMEKRIRAGQKAPNALATYVSLGGSLRNATSTDIPQDARGDLLLSHLKLVTEGSDQVGYRVTAQSFGLGGVNFYVVKLNGKYRVVPYDQTERFVGNLVVEKVKAGQLDSARKWLDWVREDLTAAGEDDPLSGPLLTHFWRKGQSGDKDAILNAAASLIVSGDQVEPSIPILIAGRKKATTDQERIYFDHALALAYEDLERWAEARPFAEAVHAGMPSSITAFRSHVYVLAETKQWSAVEQLVKERLAKDEHDLDAIEMLMDTVERQGKFQEALKLAASGLNETKPRASLMNNYAWDSLFVDPMPKDAVETAQRGSRLLESRDFGVLHTLACLYAEVGRTGEARQLMVQAMEANAMEEPESNVWYVFGRIAEQYGRLSSAETAYERVEQGRDRPNSTYQLAQKRLHAIKQSNAATKIATQ